MGWLVSILIFIVTSPTLLMADMRVKVRSTHYFDVSISLGEVRKVFNSEDIPKEEIYFLPTSSAKNGGHLEICYSSRKQKGQPNAKNLGFVHTDYLGKGQTPESIRSVSPDGSKFVSGARVCEHYKFKVETVTGVDEFEITAIDEPPKPPSETPAPLPESVEPNPLETQASEIPPMPEMPSAAVPPNPGETPPVEARLPATTDPTSTPTTLTPEEKTIAIPADGK